MRFDEFAEPHRADKLNVQLDGGVTLGAARLACRDRHGVVGERHQHAAVQIAGAVEMLWRNDKPEASPLSLFASPDRSDQVTESRVAADDFPARAGWIERAGWSCLRLVIHARTCAFC